MGGLGEVSSFANGGFIPDDRKPLCTGDSPQYTDNKVSPPTENSGTLARNGKTYPAHEKAELKYARIEAALKEDATRSNADIASEV